MDERIAVLSVSEMGTVIVNGEKQSVPEYSLSKVGPCEETKDILSYAKSLGRKIMAKVQINNSWEFATVPFVPVFELVKEHMQNLKTLGVGGLMMSWTLGGYPSVSLDLATKIFDEDFDYDRFFRTLASNWRTLTSLETEAYSIEQDSHPLAYLRTNAVVVQFEEFHKTYGTKEGDGMYLAPERRLEIW
jgi:hypothetical protein